MDLNNLDKPLNIDERYLYDINIRLNILIDMFSSFLDVYAKNNEIASTSNEVIEDVKIEKELEGQLSIEEEIDYNTLTKSEIQEVLTHKEIEFNSRMTKAELINLLK